MGNELTTFWLVVQCLKQLQHSVSHFYSWNQTHVVYTEQEYYCLDCFYSPNLPQTLRLYCIHITQLLDLCIQDNEYINSTACNICPRNHISISQQNNGDKNYSPTIFCPAIYHIMFLCISPTPLYTVAKAMNILPRK